MQIIIMSYSSYSWYKNKIGKVYKIQSVQDGNYVTKDGTINKGDAEVVGK